MNSQPDTLIAALDVGSSRVQCLIAERTGGGLVCRGYGQAPVVDMLLSGSVRDLDGLEAAIRTAVSKAEKIAGQTLSEVFVSFRGGDPKSHTVEAEIDVAGRAVTADDIVQVTADARLKVEAEDGRVMLHAIPAAYSIDGDYHPKPPVGLFGDCLGANLHVISVREGPAKNMEMAVRRAQLNVSGLVHAGYASALSTLSADERDMGAACIDMGAGLTDIQLFFLGSLMHAEQLPQGQQSITQSIMQTLSTTRHAAETLKVKHGAAICDSADAHRHIDVVKAGTKGGEVSEPLARLTSLMEAKTDEQLTALAHALEAAGFTGAAGQRVVLTGGGAQVRRIGDSAERILARDVRIGEPMGVSGMPENTHGPAQACLIGLALFGAEAPRIEKSEKVKPKGPMGRFFEWMKDSF